MCIKCLHCSSFILNSNFVLLCCSFSCYSAVFFYVGNEADVTLYVEHTGLMWENAQAMNARIVFAEHRYYGESQPFGAASSMFYEYMTHEQALADYAELAYYLSTEAIASGGVKQPFIAFGGMYIYSSI
jgi:lysosomal Pro-X carboxypeptidase